MKKADSNKNSTKIYLKEEDRKWWDEALWKCKKDGTSVSRVVMERVLKSERFPFNAADIFLRFVSRQDDTKFVPKNIRRDEYDHLKESYEALYGLFDGIHPILIDDESIGPFADENEEYQEVLITTT